jgi:alpha-galactosidase
MWRYDVDLKPTWHDHGGGVGDLIQKMSMNTSSDEAGGGNWTEKYRLITGPGAFNDPDFLVVGCPTDGPCEPFSMAGYPPLSNVEQRTQMTIWSIMAAPLIVGSDIRNLSKHAMDTLTNADVISINQDVFARDPFAVPVTSSSLSSSFNVLAWGRKLREKGAMVALAIVNLSDGVIESSEEVVVLVLSSKLLGFKAGHALTVKNVWLGTTVEMMVGDSLTVSVGIHEAALYMVAQK